MIITLPQLVVLLLAVAIAAGIGFYVAQARANAASAAAIGAANTLAERAKAEGLAAKDQARAAESRLAVAEQTIAEKDREARTLREALASRDAAAATFDARIKEFERAQAQLKEAFQSLSAEALRQNNDAFLLLARTELEKASAASQVDLTKREQAIQTLVDPIREQLAKYDDKLLEIEAERLKTTQSLGDYLTRVEATNLSLRTETQKLIQSLRAPSVRGRWGEVQLKRVVELAGMLEHCDFTTQDSVDAESGRLRPDMTVRLPNEKVIVVDAKTPLIAYLESIELPDGDGRKELLATHARHIRSHVDALGKKAYWDQFGDASPEFVVLFLPGEVFFSAALQADPSLIEETVAQRVIIATPTTLIALLKAVAYGWKQEQITRNAREIQALGKDLYERLSTFGDHFGGVAKGLTNAVRAYNSAVGSLDARVFVTARKFEQMGIGDGKGLAELELIEASVREAQAAELSGGESGTSIENSV